METDKAQKEHVWLQQLLGQWTMEGECDGPPGEPPMKSSGTESVRGLGDLWVVCEGKGTMPGGGPCEMLMTLGYDTAKKAFVGHWAGSMMSGMFVYRGTLDEAGKVLTLDTEGPSFKGDGSTAHYQDVITIKSKDERTLHSQAKQPDGSWQRFMTATYRRVK
ncbi:Protein of unknown function [Polaromonas sp. OV174]|uniref:DUF1579 domain-containing protein n=1 Tax=Polaromonas sp. OV174 TaxID=1855300 RepID=UPI0008F0DFA3|nr:DUF1579 domain-containing protein [Polaromonas sp. OV174]SFC60094.1 Protein of unknown function [Polaromonas sp. OV174]